MTRADGVRIGLKLGQGAPIETHRSVWRLAEEAGFDHCWAMDHLISFGPGGATGDIFEGWSLLAAMAVATSKLRMGLLVTAATFRHPAQLAKQAVTVDHLSGGRLEFGIGAGWAVEEHRMFGIGGLDHRVGLLSEALQVVKLLWSQPQTDFSGRYFQLQGGGGRAKAGPAPASSDSDRRLRSGDAAGGGAARRRLEPARQDRALDRGRGRTLAAPGRGERGGRPRPGRGPPVRRSTSRGPTPPRCGTPWALTAQPASARGW